MASSMFVPRYAHHSTFGTCCGEGRDPQTPASQELGQAPQPALTPLRSVPFTAARGPRRCRLLPQFVLPHRDVQHLNVCEVKHHVSFPFSLSLLEREPHAHVSALGVALATAGSSACDSKKAWSRLVRVTMPTTFPSATTGRAPTRWASIRLTASVTGRSGATVMGKRCMISATVRCTRR